MNCKLFNTNFFSRNSFKLIFDTNKNFMILKKFILNVILLITLILGSCSENDPYISFNDSSAAVPDALSQFDNSNFGIYKGVFVGSSGTILVNINNNGLISVSLTIDGVTYPFTSNVSITENEQTEITFAYQNNSFTFTVEADGSNPLITNVSIEGHPDASIIVVKENSSYVAKLYEGTYEGVDQNNDEGTFNAIVFSNEVYVLYKSTVYGSTSNASGTVDGNVISGVSSMGTVFTGNIDNDVMNGTWTTTQSNENGIWALTRSDVSY